MEIFDRKLNRETSEMVYGDFFVRLAYGQRAGRKVVGSRIVQKALSHLIGWAQRRSHSRKNIFPFVEKYQINLNDFVVPEKGFESFDDFFVRRLQKGARSFPSVSSVMGALAEGRLSVFKISGEKIALMVKGEPQSIATLVGSVPLAQEFVGGYAFVFRLCPVDYHRFHFPDSGTCGPSVPWGNFLHSVNPLAQLHTPDVFLVNERYVSCFASDHFKKLAIIEVGALAVGKVHQNYHANQPIERGQEKGYFSFGGSTVILLTTPDSVLPDADLLERSARGVESLVRLGEQIAVRINA